MKTVFFLNHNAVQCGIAQYGRDLYECLKGMDGFDIIYHEADGKDPHAGADVIPDAAIYNYSTQTMPLIDAKCPSIFNIPHLCIRHDDMSEEAANKETQGGFFSHFIYLNPAVGRKPPYVFTTGRLVPHAPYEPRQRSSRPVISTFGFATSPKRLDWLCKEVKENFHSAWVRLHMPSNPFADPHGDAAKTAFFKVVDALPRDSYTVTLSEDWRDREGMVRWLQDSDLNVFLYGPEQKGISSALDLAIAAGRPIALNRVQAFAHITRLRSPYVEDYPAGEGLRSILKNNDTFDELRAAWSPDNLRAQWKAILEEVTA